LKTKGVQVLWT